MTHLSSPVPLGIRITRPIAYMPARPLHTDTISIAALVAGVLGFCLPGVGLVGTVLGAIGMGRAARPDVGGRGFAIAGLVCGLCGTLLMMIPVAMVLPSVGRVYENAHREKCAATLTQIGEAMRQYCNANDHAYPPDFATLLQTGHLQPRMLVCPGSSSSPVPFTDDVQARADGSLDFVFTGEGMMNRTAISTDPIAFERLADHGHDGAHVLFGDGHVEFVSKSQLVQRLAPLKGTVRLTQEEHDAIVAK